MKRGSLPIVARGKKRLREAVEAQLRRTHHEELSKATNPLQKASVENTIQREIREEMKRVATPFSLWNSV